MEITDIDRQEYFRSILGQVPFKTTYMAEKSPITVRTLSANKRETLRRFCIAYPEHENKAYIALYVEFTDGWDIYDTMKKDPQMAKELLDEYFEELPEQVYDLLFKAVHDFLELVEKLKEEVISANF